MNSYLTPQPLCPGKGAFGLVYLRNRCAQVPGLNCLGRLDGAVSLIEKGMRRNQIHPEFISTFLKIQ